MTRAIHTDDWESASASMDRPPSSRRQPGLGTSPCRTTRGPRCREGVRRRPRSGKGHAAYCAAKAALWSQTDSIRQEFKPHGVNVTALHVGDMDTDRLAHVDAPKSGPAIVAAAALDGVERNLVEVPADADSRALKAGLSADRGAAATG